MEGNNDNWKLEKNWNRKNRNAEACKAKVSYM